MRLFEVMNKTFKWRTIPHEVFFKVCSELVELKALAQPLRKPPVG
jgi:hypothetical protein